MKLGIAYNVFNGDELILYSLSRLRKHADYIQNKHIPDNVEIILDPINLSVSFAK
jgi:hypothetical protein|tara:strand:- start:151 stop:315 length:165 start_codon:yes stop_codon:yes gene_type:complete